MASLPSSHRQRTSFFPTPLIGDVLFSERVVCQTKAVPAYGTAHPNAARWPDHKLVFVKERPEPESVDTFDFYYAADRASQDSYNFSHTEADIGGTKFDAVARTYVIPRASFTPNTPAMGATMPDVPASLFPGSHVLAEKRQTRIGEQELDSLYVAETHVYVKRATLSDVKLSGETGRVKRSVTNLYYRGETVSGTAVETLAASPTNAYWGQQTDGVFRELDQLSENWFAIIESNVIPEGSINSTGNPAKTRVINRVTPLGTDLYFTEVGAMPATVPAYGSAHYDSTNWPNHKLSLISPADASGLLFTFHYVADRASQDNYNFSHTKADIGGTKFDAVARTYVTLRSAFTPNTPAMGATMPNVPASLFPGSHVLAEKRQTRIGEQELDSLYVAETHVYVKRATITDNGFNEALGVNLSRTTTLYYRGELVSGVAIETLVADDKNAYWGTQVNLKISRSGEQLSDNWFAVTEQQITLKRGTSGALTDDWPIGQVKSKGKNIFIPQKFRIGTEVVETTTPLDLSAANVDNLPAPATPTGDEVEVRVTKINDYRYEKKITTETVNANTNPLVGEEYGNIVTYSTSEELVDEGDLADTGLEIVNSKVEPLGDGKAIKTTTEVKGGTWPDPLSKEVTNEGPGLPPQRYRKDVTLTKTSKKIAASAIPASPVLSGNEIAKQYVKETPDRAEEIVTTQVLNLNVSNVDTAVDRKPFVSITSTMTPGNAPVLPATGNGNARLVYENGTNLIYENTSEVAEAIPGTAGTEKDEQVFVTKNTDKRYSTENTVSTATGVSRVVFNDGAVQVYEVDEVTSTGKYGAAGTEERTQTFVKLTTDKFYNPTGTVTGNGSSRKIYDDGQTVVYEESRERAEAIPGTAGTEKDARVGYTLTTEKEYSTSNTVTGNLGSSRVAFNDGNIQVYEVSNVTASAKPIDFVGGKIASPLVTETTTTRYSTSPEGEDIYNSRVAFTDGDLVIYEVNSTTVEPLASRTYSTVISARVPAVLRKIEFKKWDRRDGGSRTAVNVTIEEGYVGSFPGRITEFFTKDPNAAEGFEAQQMRPKSISYSGHNFSISIPPTLHPAIYFDESTGTEDPVWEYETYRFDVPATEPTSVPTGFVPYALDVQPFKDGYIVRKIEIKYK